MFTLFYIGSLLVSTANTHSRLVKSEQHIVIEVG
jgi:hypothetical protein